MVATRADEVKASIKSSRLWFRIKKLYLKTNMRVEFTFVAIYRYSTTFNRFCENFKSFLELSGKFKE